MDRLVTVFGGGGFIGRYVTQGLLKAGWRVRIAQRDPKQAWYLKPLGGLGQTQFVACDIRKPDSVARALQGSEAVVNLVGILKGNFKAFHMDGAANIARAAAEAGVKTLVHMSAIGADPESPSAYGRSKGKGEEAVRAAFPNATILRPSVVFGREDNFVNRFARMGWLPVLPVIRGASRLQPVFVGDVARAVCAAITDPGAHAGQTYEIGGPQVMTMLELNQFIARQTGRDHHIADIPDAAGSLMARAVGWLPGAPITWDQWLMLTRDNVVSDGAKGLKALGITPTPLAAVTEGWLTAYRRHGRFAAKSPY
ncbi:complex I NDUFA9 subunit family protein [Allosphingosinicella vermicomposti]|uniref:complex I NDUFA9 subunit family protein n=1 Tax=Allosphingosinicella vermicomposti TaxID=614671 RepID=UPI000D0F835B|nr:complex I NDUFA9 subunit family protein [Allosphingosinicella vermicomposti]